MGVTAKSIGGMAAVFLAIISLSAIPVHSQEQVPGVGVIKVKEQEMSLTREYVGHVEAIQQVEIKAKVQGYIEDLRFKEGSLVKAGDLLYVIEQAPFRAELEMAEARLEQAKAELFRASQYLQRLREVRQGGVSLMDMDKATTDELKAKADLRLREAELKNAKINLGYTEIRAPISGKVGSSAFKKGDLVGPSSGVLTKIVALDPIRVVFAMSERDMAYVSSLKGQPERFWVEFAQSGVGALKVPAELEFIDNQVDPKTATVLVYLRVKNPDGGLLPGLYGKVLLKETGKKGSLAIPQRAVLQDQRGRYALVVEDSQVKEKRITTGKMIKDKWVVEDGLFKGDLVVVEGIQKVRPGQKVTFRELEEGTERP